MLAVSLAQLRAHAYRLVATGLSIVIAVGFVVATLVLNDTIKSTVFQAVAAQFENSDTVITAGSSDSSDSSDSSGGESIDLTARPTLLSEIRQIPGVSAVAPDQGSFLQAKLPGSSGYRFAQLTALAADGSLRWQKLSSGRFAQTDGEVVVGNRRGVTIGSTVSLLTSPNDGDQPHVYPAKVVGLVDVSDSPGTAGITQIFATPAQTAAWGAQDLPSIRVAAAKGVSAKTLTNRIRADLAHADLAHTGPTQAGPTQAGEQNLFVRTGDQQAEQVANSETGAAAGITDLLLAFAVIAVLVCTLVIANTFTVLLAQRTRELALLRCVGATGRQLRRGVLIESAITGLIASAIGVIAGISLTAVLSAVATHLNSPVPVAHLSVRLRPVLIGLAVGLVVTVLAAYLPAGRATRVAPLAALRPHDPAPLRSRAGLLRRAIGVLLLIPSGLILVYASLSGSFLIAVASGVLSFIAVILLAGWLVPPVVAGIGRLIGPAGRVPGELAASNATRNPQRTAATAIALIIGVTLTTTMVVGAASARASTSSILNEKFPTDVVIQNGSQAALPAGLARAVTAVPNVTAALALPGALVTGPGSDQAQVLGIDPAAASVVRSAVGAGVPAPGRISVPTFLAVDWHVQEGSPVRVSIGSRHRQLRAHLIDGDLPASMTAADLATLAPRAGIVQVWARLADGLDADGRSKALDSISGTAADVAPTSMVEGALQERDSFDHLVSVLLLIVTGLLAIAVVIALIGVGNTMALSVLERRQESGLLRALGLTRGQLRWMLLWEAALIAGVAALIGTVLGVLYGALGTSAVLSPAGKIHVSMPWGQLAAIVVVATAAGALASVLPSRRAARTSPVAAIAA